MFNEKLQELYDREGLALSHPGIYEIASEHFNNQVLEELRTEKGDAPCERSPDQDPDGTSAWNCDNDHTGCLHNDGNNTCMHDGDSLSPLED